MGLLNYKALVKSFQFFFSFSLFEIFVQLLNFSLSCWVGWVFYVFNFHFPSPANLSYIFSIVISRTTHYVISVISLAYLRWHFLPVSIPISISLVYSADIIFYSNESLCVHTCIVFVVQQFSFYLQVLIFVRHDLFL